jgi:CRISPR-associated protein Csx17
MTNDVALAGCRLEPLGSYLKAIGLHRLVAEQRDPTAAGQWQAGSYVLRSGMNDEGLLDFLVSDYRPTPLVAPWNGRGGFRRDAGRESEKVVQEIETRPRRSCGVVRSCQMRSLPGLTRRWF